MNLALIVFIGMALIFVFINGFHDSVNIVTNAVASRAIPLIYAFPLVALAEFIGPFLFGVAIATTIGEKILSENAITIPVASSALIAAIFWNLFTWWSGIPSSSSHSLIGGFLGAAIMGYGIRVIRVSGILQILIGLFVSPVIGLILGWMAMRLILLLSRSASPRINNLFCSAQWLTLFTVGLVHGSNDAQNTMGVITLGLVAFGFLPDFYVPFWVKIICAMSISLGSALGGWRVVNTKSGKFYRIRPIHAFTSQIATTIDVLGCALLGAPASTTQIISTTTLGAGSAERIQKVHWLTAGQIVLTWILTIPASGLISAVLYLILKEI